MRGRGHPRGDDVRRRRLAAGRPGDVLPDGDPRRVRAVGADERPARAATGRTGARRRSSSTAACSAPGRPRRHRARAFERRRRSPSRTRMRSIRHSVARVDRGTVLAVGAKPRVRAVGRRAPAVSRHVAERAGADQETAQPAPPPCCSPFSACALTECTHPCRALRRTRHPPRGRGPATASPRPRAPRFAPRSQIPGVAGTCEHVDRPFGEWGNWQPGRLWLFKFLVRVQAPQ